jgi:hypothetical protein
VVEMDNNLKPVSQIEVSFNEERLLTSSLDGFMKIYDLGAF